MSVTGQPDGTPGGGPVKVGAPVADVLTGVYAFASVLLALRERDHSGRGQHIDLSLLDCAISGLSVVAANFLATAEVPTRHGCALPTAVPSDAMQCADGHVMIMVGTDLQFLRLCSCIGRPELPTDPRFSSNEQRVGAREELMALLRPVFRAYSRAHWIEVLAAAAVPCGPINDLGEVFDDPQVRERGVVVALGDERFPGIRVLGNPIRLSRTPPAYAPPPTRLGATAVDPEDPARLWRDTERGRAPTTRSQE